MLSFGGSTCKFPHETAVFAYRSYAIRATPRTLFPPAGSAIFRFDVAKKSLWKIRENTHLEKGLLKPNARQSEGFLRRPRDPGASKTANDQGKHMVL